MHACCPALLAREREAAQRNTTNVSKHDLKKRQEEVGSPCLYCIRLLRTNALYRSTIFVSKGDEWQKPIENLRPNIKRMVRHRLGCSHLNHRHDKCSRYPVVNAASQFESQRSSAAAERSDKKVRQVKVKWHKKESVSDDIIAEQFREFGHVEDIKMGSKGKSATLTFETEVAAVVQANWPLQCSP